MSNRSHGSVRKLLASRQPTSEATLNAWLERTNPDTVTVILDDLADGTATQEEVTHEWWHSALQGLWILIVGFLFHFITLETGYLAPAIALLLAIAYQALHFFSARDERRVVQRATLLLAQLGQPQAVRPLCNVWTPHPKTRADAAFNTTVTQALTRLLEERGGKSFGPKTEKALRGVLTRATATTKQKCRFSRLTQPFHPAPDLTEADTDLLLQVVRHLSHRRTDPLPQETTASETALRQVAAELPPAGPHTRLLRDTAQTLLNGHG